MGEGSPTSPKRAKICSTLERGTVSADDVMSTLVQERELDCLSLACLGGGTSARRFSNLSVPEACELRFPRGVGMARSEQIICACNLYRIDMAR